MIINLVRFNRENKDRGVCRGGEERVVKEREFFEEE